MKDRIIIKQASITHIIKFDEILYCEADVAYSSIHQENNEIITCTCTLSKLYSQLPDSKFLRISQSAIVNKQHICKIHNKQKELEISNGQRFVFTCKYNQLLENITIQDET